MLLINKCMICVGETDWNKKNCLLTPSRRQITEWCPLCFTLESSDGMSSSLFDKRSLTWHSGLITFFNPLNVCMDHFALFLTTSVPSQNLWIEIDLTYNLPKGTWITLQRLCYCPYHFWVWQSSCQFLDVLGDDVLEAIIFLHFCLISGFELIWKDTFGYIYIYFFFVNKSHVKMEDSNAFVHLSITLACQCVSLVPTEDMNL